MAGLRTSYHLSKDLVDRAIGMIADAKQVAPDRPFFMYFCPGAGHAPHHAPEGVGDKYKGRFDKGYEAIRESILARQKSSGMVPEKTELSPINPLLGQKSVDGKPHRRVDIVRPWDSLSEDEKTLCVRMAEVYAGFSQLHRRRDRPADRLPRAERRARQHLDRRRSPTTAPRVRAARTARSTRTSS